MRIEDFAGIVCLHTRETFAREPRPAPRGSADLCIAYGRCIECCWNQAIALVQGIASPNRVRCEGCLACYYVCPTDAITMKLEEDRAES